VDLGNRNTLDFFRLPVGQFVLRVQGANPDGVWSTEGIAINIRVHPPFYLTWYAYVLYTLTVLSLFVLVIYRQRRKERVQLVYQSQLESDVRSRTRDLRSSNEKLQVAVDEIDRAREEAVHANQTKSEFLAALSHEIRTPMHGVLGMTDLLLHSALNERQQGFAESAHTSANELLGLIDNILDFSKIEAGKLELEETAFNLREMLENTCYLYAELAQAKSLELNLIFNTNLRRQLYGDPMRLRQILQNLLSNAIKFTRRGSINVTVNEISRQGKTVSLEFLVEDSGIGMDERALERVFEAFSQADSSTTRQYGGTGLGLSIAKQLIELMHGQLRVHSKPGVGTTMGVEVPLIESPIYSDQLAGSVLDDSYAEIVAPLPETRAMFKSQLEAMDLRVRECATVEELAPIAEHRRLVLIDVLCLYNSACIAQVENVAEDPLSVVLLVTPLSAAGIPSELAHLPHTTKPVRSAGLVSDILAAESNETPLQTDEAPLMSFSVRVLLVEDIAANQEIARAMLESFGCTVAIAKDGEVALDMVQQDEFDIILMDCQMPVMDGFEATRHIRQYESQQHGGRRTPVVALTAGKTETEKERCFASGMDRILFKPYSTKELNSMLSQYFESSAVVARSGKRSAASTSPRSELVDEKALDNIRSIESRGSNSLLRTVFENFKVDAVEKLDELRGAIGDARSLVAGAHAIKSMSLSMGAKALSEYSRSCEAQWKLGEIGEAPKEIEVLARHVRDAVEALEQLLQTDNAAS
jgi:signal transduction histidine kinase/CheY-like chemotaxis protein